MSRDTHLAGEDAPHAIVTAIAASISDIAGSGHTIRDIHDVRVRQTSAGLVVTYHCHAEPSLDVQTVHDSVDGLEREARSRHPEIVRVFGHAEPG
ncbi:MAG: cation transporter dimerization domain-containing protein [Rhizobiaceae bacterium]